MPGMYGPADLQREFQLSDEVKARLQLYAALLEKWQRHINLVSRATLPDLWFRHICDSAQLAAYVQNVDGAWLDLGSGAGFPGMVLALMGVHGNNPIQLIESDQRKSEFLREVIRRTGARAEVQTVRAEQLNPELLGGPAGLIMARGLAPLHKLLDLTWNYTTSNTVYLILKGQDVDRELTEAAKYRKMSVLQHPSRTNPAGRVLRITEVARV